jgi:hypothetical protein
LRPDGKENIFPEKDPNQRERTIDMQSYPTDSPAGAKAASGRSSGVFNVYSMSASAILVNIMVEAHFEYSALYRLASLAIRTGGGLDGCNGDMALFSFPNGGITAFMEGIGFEVPVSRTVVSPKDKGVSKVNIRFKP